MYDFSAAVPRAEAAAGTVVSIPSWPTDLTRTTCWALRSPTSASTGASISSARRCASVDRAVRASSSAPRRRSRSVARASRTLARSCADRVCSSTGPVSASRSSMASAGRSRFGRNGSGIAADRCRQALQRVVGVPARLVGQSVGVRGSLPGHARRLVLPRCVVSQSFRDAIVLGKARRRFRAGRFQRGEQRVSPGKRCVRVEFDLL